MEDAKTKKMSDIAQKFHSHLANIIKIVESKVPGHMDIDRIRRIIALARDADPLLIINACKNKIWDARERILASDEDYFINKDYSTMIKKDENQAFIENVVVMVRTKRHLLSDNERKYLWKTVKNVLQDIIEYKLVIGDYNDYS